MRRHLWRNVAQFLCVVHFNTIVVVVASNTLFLNDENTNQTIYNLIGSGRISEARSFALQQVLEDPRRKKQISQCYIDAFDHLFQREENFDRTLALIRTSSCRRDRKRKYDRLMATHDTDGCISDLSEVVRHAATAGTDVNGVWDDSCSLFTMKSKISLKSGSIVGQIEEQTEFFPCCELRPGNWGYIRLPALLEPAIRLVIPRSELDLPPLELNLEQDGYLRPFDVSTIFWPTGYLLSVCLGNWLGCPIVELNEVIQDQIMTGHNETISSKPFALELGAGIGAPSIALSRSVQDYLEKSGRQRSMNRTWTITSDKSLQSLALTISNVCNNELKGDFISTALLDYTNMTSIQGLKDEMFPLGYNNSGTPDGFSLIFGSSLQTLFRDSDQSDSMLWKVLDFLLDTTNPRSTVLLGHTRSDTIKVPTHSALFQSCGCVVLDHMETRDGNVSDFEMCVFRRTVCSNLEPKFMTQEEL